MSKPSFPFYPDDWLNDLALRNCSPAARAIWADLLCLAHQGTPYGHLRTPAGDIPVKHMAERCNVTPRQFGLLVSELDSHRVFSRTDTGTIYSRRMVRDEEKRIARGAGGYKSLGHPDVPKPKNGMPAEFVSKGILPIQKAVASFDAVEVKEKETVELKANGKQTADGDPPQVVLLSEYPKTIAAIREYDAAVDEAFVRGLANKVAHTLLSHKDFPPEKIPKATRDAVIAKACRRSFDTGPSDHRAGLLLARVPSIIVSWGIKNSSKETT